MSAELSSIAPNVRAPQARSIRRHFLLILGLGSTVWILLLIFFFPGYLDPFVPYHVDHFSILGESADGYGLMRYIRYYPRPIGFIITDLIGRLGTRGMLVPIFALTLVNAALLIRYVERLTSRAVSVFTITFFFVLVFANPQSYWSVKEDILAVVCLSCVLVIFHLWQNYLQSGLGWNVVGIIALALFSSYIKETYFATLAIFFLVQALAFPQRRKTAFALAIAIVLIGGLSLIYNTGRSPFVNTRHASTDIYFQDWSPMSIGFGYSHLLKFLIFPVPAILVIGALVAVGRRSRKELWIGLVSLLFVVTTLFPHTLLPNHLEDLYAWLGAFFLFTPVLLVDAVIPKRGVPLVLAAIGAVAVCAATMMEYTSSISKGMASWLRKQEQAQRIYLQSWPIMKNIAGPGERELVIAPSIPFQPFAVPGYIRKSLGTDTHWTVVLPDTFRKTNKLTTQVIHGSDLVSLAYDHVFVFSPDARLVGSYSRRDAQAIFDKGGFTQFPGLRHADKAPSAPTALIEAASAGVVLRADPNPLPGGTVTGKTTIIWDAGPGTLGDVYTGTSGSERLFASAPNGSQEARWIKPGSTEFRLYSHADHRLLAQLIVTMPSPDAASIKPSGTPMPPASPN
ncbi:MAG TPA: hypothetical protein VJU77_09200 [Chthoniobacterales bacterium]|nr:hypothetical protein [Chthoniobacterales bacterium]